MNIEIVLALTNILDPFGIYEISPNDEYKDVAIRICELIYTGKSEIEIEKYLSSLYINDNYVQQKKIKEFVRLLNMLV